MSLAPALRMKNPFCGKLLALASFALFGTPVQAEETGKPAPVVAAVALEKDNYRISNYVVACYSIGNAAVRGQKGVIYTSMLVRPGTFHEWIAVYYDPKLITEEKLGQLLRERRCPTAKLDRDETSPLTVMNRAVGPGDLAQLRIDAGKNPGITKVELPVGWQVVGEAGGFRAPGDVTYFTIRIPKKEKFGIHPILLHPKEGEPLKAEIEVVQKAG